MKKIFKFTFVFLSIFWISSCGFFNKEELPKGIPPSKGAPVPYININSPGRTSLLLQDWAGKLTKKTGIPAASLQAYGNAAEILRQTKPECGIGWTTIAGIAAIESKHGFHSFSKVDQNGNISPPILGPVLDGSPGLMEIRDSDKGKYDGDMKYDRAVGPFQFLPETWEKFGTDANGDGIADPNNIDDAALSAGIYLCFYGGNLATAAGWKKAILTYNNSMAYLEAVRDKAAYFGLAKINN